MIAVLGVAGGRVPPGTEALLAGADVVAGGRAVLDALAPAGARRVVLGAGIAAALEALAAEPGAVCVLASGDPGFFGVVRALGEAAGPERLDVHPAPSSVALAFARLGLPWDDALVVSAHGRDPRPAIHTALRHPKVAILTEPRAPAALIADALDGRTVLVAEALGTPAERIRPAAPGLEYAEPNVVIALDPRLAANRADRWALGEDAFEHRAGMITKAEVRAVALAALGPGTGDLVWDVGCGSGSVAIECARLGAAAIGIDADAGAIALTGRNADAHGVPVRTVHGAAPDALAGLPDPDATFVGGGGGALDAILGHAAPRTRRAVVVTVAIVERIAPTLHRLASHGLEATATTIQASRVRPLAGGHRLAAENPVTVITGEARVKLVVGVGCSLGCPADELDALVACALASVAGDVVTLATVDRREAEPCVLALAARRGVPLRTHSARALAAIEVPTPSDVVARHVGTPSVAEAAALLSAGPGARLAVAKRRSPHATCAIAEVAG